VDWDGYLWNIDKRFEKVFNAYTNASHNISPISRAYLRGHPVPGPSLIDPPSPGIPPTTPEEVGQKLL